MNSIAPPSSSFFITSTVSAMASDDWERYKAIILHLYLLEKAPLHQVISYMQRRHDFAKKKSQYEYQFKKWGIRKNLKKEDWQHLRAQLQKRTGKQSEVTFFGIPLSPGRIRKETQRYTAIPPANEFGKRPPSPQLPSGIMVRVQTPPTVENITWPSLPWFRFKNKIFPALRNPSGLLNTLFAALGSDESFSGYKGESTLISSLGISKNPLELRKAIFNLASMIPDDSVLGCQKAEALVQKQLPLSMAMEILKVVFFILSNNNIPYSDEMDLRAHDQFVLLFVQAVSRSNPEMLLCILSGHCPTTNAIKGAVYGSAIRRKDYAIILLLLESGIDPNMEIQTTTSFIYMYKREMVEMDFRFSPMQWSGIHEAAFTCDARLGKMLLNAGASVENPCINDISVLEVAAFAGVLTGAPDNSVKFARLLIEHGAVLDHSACRKCSRSKSLLPIFISIARKKDRMAEFLIEKDANARPYQYIEISRRGWNYDRWSSSQFIDLGIRHNPLNTAIVFGNKELIGRLLQPLLSHTGHISMRVVKEALITSSLVGDADTVSQLLAHHPDLLTIDEWTRGVTPMVATAWNKDVTIAEILLKLGARVGSKPEDGILRASTPAPIHVAAYYGNTRLVRHLIYLGADCNVRYRPPPRSFRFPLSWLLPVAVANPLQMALWRGSGDVVTPLVSSGKPVQEIALGDNVSISDAPFEGVNLWTTNRNARAVFETTTEIGNAFLIIQSYFSLGGLYRSRDLHLAVRAAIESKDYSIVRLLADHRPIGEIDSHEASSLVLCMEERERDLVSLLLRDPFLPGPSRSHYQIDTTRQKHGGHKGLNTNIGYPDCSGLGSTPLGWAINLADESVVKEMIQRGYKLQDEDMPILVARDVLTDARAATLALYLLESIDLSCRQLLLLCSIQSCDMQKVQKCIGLVDSLDFGSAFYDVDGYKHRGFPLGLAADSGNVELVRLLLDAGASVEFEPFRDRSALKWAVIKGHLDIVKVLLDKGATVEPPRRSEQEMTALQHSAIRGHLSIAKLLISRGANINALPAKGFGGSTALEGAAENGRLDMVQFLLGQGAKLDGEMRIYYVRSVGFAKRNGHYGVTNFLKEKGQWGERDQALHDQSGVLGIYAHFRYDEEMDKWHIRKTGWGPGSDSSVEWSDSDFPHSSEESEVSELNDAEENDDLLDRSYDMDCTPQAWWDGIDLTVAEPFVHNFNDDQTLGHGLASCQITTSPRVIELEETLEDSGIEEKATGNSAVDEVTETTADYLATDWMDIWEQESMIKEGEPDLEMHDYTLGTDFVAKELMPSNAAETEWEGPFSNLMEVDDEISGLLRVHT